MADYEKVPLPGERRESPSIVVEDFEYALAHKRAEEVRRNKLEGRNPQDFIGTVAYSAASIEEIEQRLKKYHQKTNSDMMRMKEDDRAYMEKKKSAADCLEGICLSMPSWFGINTETYATTEWDDVFNHIDMLASQTNPGGVDYGAFGLDVTHANKEILFEKMRHVADHVMKGELGKVDFFMSKDGLVKGELGGLPMFIVGCDGTTLKSMIKLYAAPHHQDDDKLREHVFQFQLIDQILHQCDLYVKIAKQHIGDPVKQSRVVAAYERMQKWAKSNLLGKRLIHKNTSADVRDHFHERFLECIDACARRCHVFDQHQ